MGQGVLTDTLDRLANDIFVKLLDMKCEWKLAGDTYEGRMREGGDLKWIASGADLSYGSNPELTSITEQYACEDAGQTFVDDFAGRMEVVGEPATIPPVQAEVQEAIDRADGRAARMVPIERFAFYDRARTAFAVVQTGERRFYGCFAFRKGVIPPDA